MNNIVTFDPNAALPALPEDLARAGQEMNAALSGGLQGRLINRLTVRNGRWVMMRGGELVERIQNDYIDVVIVASADKVSRIFYLKGYDANAPKERPTCWSHDGVAPAADVPDSQRQGNACASCPKNEKGSAADGKSRACAFKKQIVVVPGGSEEVRGIGSAEPVPWLLTVNAQSMYDDSRPASNEYSLKGYTELLRRPRPGAPNGVPVGYVLTRITTDPESTTVKYWFSPMGYLSPDLMRKSVELFRDPEVRDLLDQTADEQALAQGDRSPGVPEKDRTLPAPPVAAKPVASPPPPPVAAKPGWGEYALANGADPDLVEALEMMGGPSTVAGSKFWDRTIKLDMAHCNVADFGVRPAAAIDSKMHWREFGLAEGADESSLDTVEALGGPGTEKGRKIWDALIGAELTDDIDLSVESTEGSENPAPKAEAPTPAKPRRGRPTKAEQEAKAKAAATQAAQPAVQPPPPPPPAAPPPPVAATEPAPIAAGTRGAALADAIAKFDVNFDD